MRYWVGGGKGRVCGTGKEGRRERGKGSEGRTYVGSSGCFGSGDGYIISMISWWCCVAWGLGRGAYEGKRLW